MQRRIYTIITCVLLLMLPLTARAETPTDCGNEGQEPCEYCLDGGERFLITFWTKLFWPCSVGAEACNSGYYDATQTTPNTAIANIRGICRKIVTPRANPKPKVSELVTIDQAVAGGCLSHDEVYQRLSRARDKMSKVSITYREVTNLMENRGSLDGWITRKSVTDPETWVYRATLHPIDTNGFKHGFVPSKAHKALRKSKWINDHAGFWDGNGPRLGVPPDADLQFAFQAMALRISSIPMSQFSSVALDFDVASGFGNEIYKFQLAPNAPIMGLDNCKLSGKEAQFQIADGTQLKHLKRNILGNSYWEDYDKITDQWVKSETFKSELRKRRDSTPLASFVHEGFYYSNSTSLFDDGTLSSFGTIQDCAKRCLSTSGCDFLTYAYDGWGSRGQYCTLFSADGFTPISDSDKNYSLFRLRDR